MAYKAQVLRTEKDIVTYFNSRYVAKSLRFFAINVGPEDGELGSLHFNFNGPSYTDMKNIEIGVPAYMVGKTTVNLMNDLKWRICHEQGHRLFTPDATYKAMIKKLAKYFNKTHGIHEGLGKEMANALLNGTEDGREEARFLETHPQPIFMDMFRFGRSQWYLNNDMSKGPRANSHEPYDELFDGLFCLCTLATMGTLPLGWANKWKNNGDLYQLMLDSRKYVNAFVDAKTLEDGEKPFWALVNHLENWLADTMKKIPVQDAQQAMQQAASAMGGNAAQNNTGNSAQSCAANAGAGSGSGGNSQGQNGQSGANGQGAMNNVPINSQDPNAQQNGNDPNGQGSGASNQKNSDPNGQGQNAGQNGGQNSSSPLHAAFGDDSGGDTSGNGGRIARMEDEYDGDYGTDMEKIVSDAMKAAEEVLAESAENALIQAEFEDLQARQREEAAQGFDQKAADEVAAYYQTINPSKRGGNNWAVSFKKCRYDLPKVAAPTGVKNEAKKLNNQFAKILLSKRAFDSRNRRSGLLNTNDLHKLIGLKEDDIFMKKGNPRNAEYVFYVLMDGSGSMSGTKFNEALRACSLIEESLRGIAPVKIVVFDYSYGVRHHVVKEFKETPHNASWAYANTRSASGCNMDGFSIRVAKNELLKRPEKHKVLITLSDGQPNGPSSYSGTRGENDVSEAVLETRNKGIHVFNIFFAESSHERKTYLPSFMHMYRGKGVISCDPSNIGTELLRVVRKELC